jgi:hypothetical protein
VSHTLVSLAVGADLVGLQLQQALDGLLVLRGALCGRVGGWSSRHGGCVVEVEVESGMEEVG